MSRVAERRKTNLPSQLLHDLRSPLNQIIGYSEMLADEEEDGRRPQSYVADLGRIRSAGHQMLAIIEENFTQSDEASSAAERLHDAPLLGEPLDNTPHASAVSGLLLVIDDDATNRDVLSRRLVRQGHRVVTASNGPDALELMRGSAFDAVLLDIMMPDMDGYAVLREIKGDPMLSNVPVIMISALNEVRSVVRCLEAGAEDYLTKPFDPTLLKARISASLDRKRGRDREIALFDQLQQNYRHLQEVEKLRDDMRNMIVHDLRTPLTSVIIGVEMLERHGQLNEQQRELMALAIEGGTTLLGMINDLLDVEKMESGTTQLQYGHLSATALVGDALKQVRSLAENAETSLLTDITPLLPSFRGDENKLCRTLVNLVANAIKFTQGGTVTVSARREGEHDIRFSVRDSGHGIPAEAFERIFEKFGQVGASKVGTGLGLAFCKLAVEAHGGSITVESTLTVGSTFSFTVPVDERVGAGAAKLTN